MKALIATLTVGTVFSFAGSASAMSLSGDVRMVFAPASVQENARTNNNKALLFKEQANTVLASDLNVEAYLPGAYGAPSTLAGQSKLGPAGVGRTLAAGRAVTSYFLHADVDQDANTPVLMSGSITFNDKILGVIFDNFAASDALVGAPGTSYETAPGHGLDMTDPNGDFFRISNDRMRLDFSFYVSGITDQIRIITAGQAPLVVDDNPIPEPLTPTLLAMGLGSLALRRRHTA
ncbi:MAG: hypothetical protein Kow00105_07290 [Phycisphaeraceae bacterium]